MGSAEQIRVQMLQKRVVTFDSRVHKNAGSHRFGDDFLSEREPSVAVAAHDLVSLGRCQTLYPKFQIPLFLQEKTVPVREQEFHIAHLWTINGRMVDFSQDTAPDGEPNAAAARVCRTDAILIAIRP